MERKNLNLQLNRNLCHHFCCLALLCPFVSFYNNSHYNMLYLVIWNSFYSRLTGCMFLNKRILLTKIFKGSQFIYRPLDWMFHFRRLNIRIKSIPEEALNIGYSDHTSRVQSFLDNDSS